MNDGACSGGESRNVGWTPGARGDRAGGGNEAIAAPRHGFDEARLAGIVVERRPQFADGGLQHRVADELVAPDLVEQRVLGEQRPGLPHERAQHGEWRRRERDSCSVAQQARIRLVELESVEAHLYRIRLSQGPSRGVAFCHAGARGFRDRAAHRVGSIGALSSLLNGTVRKQHEPCSPARRGGLPGGTPVAGLAALTEIAPDLQFVCERFAPAVQR